MNRRIHRQVPIIRLPLDYSVVLERAQRRRERRRDFVSGLLWVASFALLMSILAMFQPEDKPPMMTIEWTGDAIPH